MGEPAQKLHLNKRVYAARLGLLLTAIFWGSSLTVVKTAANVFSPDLILTLRFGIAFVILALIYFKKLKRATKEDYKAGIKIGLFLFLAYYSQTLGVKNSDPGRSGFLSATYCVIVPFLEAIFYKEKVDISSIIGAFLCVIGIFSISVLGAQTVAIPSNNRIVGDLLALLSGALFAAHIVAVAHIGSDKDPILMTIIQFLTATILSSLMMIINAHPVAGMVNFEPILEVLYLAIFCTAIALLLQNIAQKNTDSTSASIILGTESVFGVLFPVLLGIEKLTVFNVIGFILIGSAILITEIKPKLIIGESQSTVSAREKGPFV